MHKHNQMNNIFSLCNLLNSSNVGVSDFEIGSILKLNGVTRKDFEHAVLHNYIKEENDHYVLAKKGRELLDQNKVDNAIILAAGMGTRFIPYSLVKPKGMVEVGGLPLVERQVQQFIEAGIEEIIIVVGHLKKHYQYLADKYDVIVVENLEYSTKNNISSLHYVRDYLKNSYITTSDIYIEENIYSKYQMKSWYACEFFDEETNEWTLKLDDQNLILEVYDKPKSNRWAMYGPAFFNEEFSEKLLIELDKIYNIKEFAQYYWEDVFKNNVDDMDMYVYKLPKDLIVEFESYEELRAYDKSYYIDSRSKELDLICEVFDIELKDISNIHPLTKGMTNDSFVFDINGGSFVYRMPGVGTSELMNRASEYEVYQIIKDLKMSDEIIYMNPKTGVKITKYIVGGVDMDSSDKTQINSALKMIRKLHKADLEVSERFDIYNRIDHYKKLCEKYDAEYYPNFMDAYSNIDPIHEIIDSYKREEILCHLDPVANNFFITPDKTYLLDWEYASMADPLIDIAMFCLLEEYDFEQSKEFLKCYLERDYTEEELMVHFSYIGLAGILWTLWCNYKEAHGESFGDYGLGQLQMGIDYTEFVLNEVNA